MATRFGRIILAGLAPLLGLSALLTPVALSANASDTGSQRASASILAELLRVVAPSIADEAQFAPALPSVRTSLQAVLPLAALANTTRWHVLWLVASIFAIDLLRRRHTPVPLRC